MMPLIDRLRREPRHSANLDKAPPMQAYMKSAMPYYGVPSPELRKICRRVFADADFSSAEAWQAQVLALWRGATHREERYAAVSLATDRRARDFRTPAALPLYEEMIVSGAWWDYVDILAAHPVGEMLRNYPGPMRQRMLQWSGSPDLWKRRTSILCQLRFKKETDLEFLYRCIEPSIDSKEFFLRKAIGWALRQYAWTDPKPILAYVRKNAKRLSPLSQREAIKNLSKISAKSSRKPTTKSKPKTISKSKARAKTQSRRRTSAKAQTKTQRRVKR